jgi:hypothetical protein
MAETEKERVDRELIELLNEIRVALPGVQVLFAFLLLLPFQQGFDAITDLERGVYLLTFVTTAAAIVLLIAPSSYHRLRFRTGEKQQMLMTSNRLVIGGLALLAVSMVGVAFLVTDVLFGSALASLVAAGLAAAFAVFWYFIPLRGRARDEARDEPEPRKTGG